jgi:hypothetical protein
LGSGCGNVEILSRIGHVPLKQKPWRHQRIRHVNEDRVHNFDYGWPGEEVLVVPALGR